MFFNNILIFYCSWCLISFSYVKCNNTTMPATITSASTELSESVKGIVQNDEGKLINFQKFTRQSVTNVIVPMVQSLFSSIMFLLRNTVLTYQWLHPELTLGRCMVGVARNQYPELMNMPLNFENVSKFVRTFYNMMTGIVVDYIGDNRQEMEIKDKEIGEKVQQLTTDDMNSISSLPIITSTSSSSQPSPNSYNFNYLDYSQNLPNTDKANEYLENNYQGAYLPINRRQSNVNFANIGQVHQLDRQKRMDAFRFGKSNFLNFGKRPNGNLARKIEDTAASKISKKISKVLGMKATKLQQRSDNFFENDVNGYSTPNEPVKPDNSIMYVGPRQFSTDTITIDSSTVSPLPTEYTDNDQQYEPEQSETDFKSAAEKGENLFDFENILLEWFGFREPKTGRSITLITCTQKYVINILWRMIIGG